MSVKEQNGLGGKYRREALEKFTNYVNEENDFPFSEWVVLERTIEKNAVILSIEMNVEDRANGMYELTVISDVRSSTYKIFIE
ncbi:hypothetical protein JYT72_00805 [Crocinitomix catalasitica]|nr:hypothetical protein [Crocinitomix catalasitica]